VKGDLAIRRRCQRSPVPTNHVDGRIHRARIDSDRSDRILGTDGLRNYGRLAGGDRSHACLSADAVSGLV